MSSGELAGGGVTASAGSATWPSVRGFGRRTKSSTASSSSGSITTASACCGAGLSSTEMIFGVLSTAGGTGSGAVSPLGSTLISSAPDWPRLSSCSTVCTGAGSSSASPRSGSTSFLCWGRGRTLIFLAGSWPGPSALLDICGSSESVFLRNWGLSELFGLFG